MVHFLYTPVCYTSRCQYYLMTLDLTSGLKVLRTQHLRIVLPPLSLYNTFTLTKRQLVFPLLYILKMLYIPNPFYNNTKNTNNNWIYIAPFSEMRLVITNTWHIPSMCVLTWMILFLSQTKSPHFDIYCNKNSHICRMVSAMHAYESFSSMFNSIHIICTCTCVCI